MGNILPDPTDSIFVRRLKKNRQFDSIRSLIAETISAHLDATKFNDLLRPIFVTGNVNLVGAVTFKDDTVLEPCIFASVLTTRRK